MEHSRESERPRKSKQKKPNIFTTEYKVQSAVTRSKRLRQEEISKLRSARRSAISASMNTSLSEKIRQNLVDNRAMSSISPTSIKIFIICHGSLKIMTQDIARPLENKRVMEIRKKNMPERIRVGKETKYHI
jgi:hypothetical protein